MPQKYIPNARDAETLGGLMASLAEYDDDRLADQLMTIAEDPQDIGLIARAIATTAANRIRGKRKEE